MEASAPADVICGTSTGGTNQTNFMAMVNATLPSRDGETIAVLVKLWLRLRLGLFEVKAEVDRKD